ncbi:hypothetical protein N0V90_007414 [Kalmusia sp. IMI 367209]|nr:hypothetical protein N0V90_007414 [Kalmusia sp. IMI 367209]
MSNFIAYTPLATSGAMLPPPALVIPPQFEVVMLKELVTEAQKRKSVETEFLKGKKKKYRVKGAGERHAALRTTEKWDEQTRAERYKRMTELRTADRLNLPPSGPTRIYVTLRIAAVISELGILSMATNTPSASDCKRVIEENWGAKIGALFKFPIDMMSAGNVEPKVLPLLVLLSEMTVGHALPIRRMLLVALKDRNGEEKGNMEARDVEGVIWSLIKNVKNEKEAEDSKVETEAEEDVQGLKRRIKEVKARLIKDIPVRSKGA